MVSEVDDGGQTPSHCDHRTRRPPGTTPEDRARAPDALQTPWPRRQPRPIMLIMQLHPTRQHRPTIGVSSRPRARSEQQRRPRQRNTDTRPVADPQRLPPAPPRSFYPLALDRSLLTAGLSGARSSSCAATSVITGPVFSDPRRAVDEITAPLLTAVSIGARAVPKRPRQLSAEALQELLPFEAPASACAVSTAHRGETGGDPVCAAVGCRKR